MKGVRLANVVAFEIVEAISFTFWFFKTFFIRNVSIKQFYCSIDI